MALARVSVSASTREPTTRIEPAEPTSSPPARNSPSVPACRRPRVGPPRATIPRIPRPAARIVMPTPGRTSRTIPANGVSSRSPASPIAIRQRLRHGKTYSPEGAFVSPRRIVPVQRAPGTGSTLSGTACSSSRGSRTRSASGAPTTTKSPAATSGRSPAARRNTASTGDVTSRRAGTSRRSLLGAAISPLPQRPRGATFRAARRGGRRGPGAGAARRACRGGGHPGRR